MHSRDPTSPDSHRRSALAAGTWSLIALVATQGIRFGGNLIMTRLLVPEMFGIMVIATTVSVVLALLSDIGLRQNIIQSKRGDDPVFLNTAWTVQIVRGFIIYAASLLVAVLVWVAQLASLWPTDTTYASPVLPIVLGVTGLSAIIAGFQSTKVATAFRSFQQKKIVLTEIAAQFSGLLVMLGIGYFAPTVWALVAAGLVASAVTTLLSHLWLDGPHNSLQWDSSSVKELVAFGRWLLLSSSIGVLAANGDRILLGGSATATELGIYAIAVLILGAFESGYSRTISAVVLPTFSEAVRRKRSHLPFVYFRTKKYTDAITLLLCGFLFSAGEYLVAILYDDRYIEAGEMLSILSLSIFIWRFTLTYQACIALGHTRPLAINNGIRFVSLWCITPVLYSIGGIDYAIWGIALHSFATLPHIIYINTKLGISSFMREVLAIPILAVGWGIGLILTRCAS